MLSGVPSGSIGNSVAAHPRYARCRSRDSRSDGLAPGPRESRSRELGREVGVGQADGCALRDVLEHVPEPESSSTPRRQAERKGFETDLRGEHDRSLPHRREPRTTPLTRICTRGGSNAGRQSFGTRRRSRAGVVSPRSDDRRRLSRPGQGTDRTAPSSLASCRTPDHRRCSTGTAADAERARADPSALAHADSKIWVDAIPPGSSSRPDTRSDATKCSADASPQTHTAAELHLRTPSRRSAHREEENESPLEAVTNGIFAPRNMRESLSMGRPHRSELRRGLIPAADTRAGDRARATTQVSSGYDVRGSTRSGVQRGTGRWSFAYPRNRWRILNGVREGWCLESSQLHHRYESTRNAMVTKSTRHWQHHLEVVTWIRKDERHHPRLVTRTGSSVHVR